MPGLYRKEPLAEGKPSPWAGKFRVEDRRCQGDAGRTGGQVQFGMVNRHLSSCPGSKSQQLVKGKMDTSLCSHFCYVIHLVHCLLCIHPNIADNYGEACSRPSVKLCDSNRVHTRFRAGQNWICSDPVFLRCAAFI